MATGTKKLNRRQFLAASAAAGGASLLAACAPQATPAPAAVPAPATAVPVALQPTAAPKVKPKIVIWCGQTYTPEADTLEDTQIKEWCAKNGVDVELARMSGDERTPKWKTAIETKKYPDIASLELNDAPRFMVTGELLETTTIVEKLNKVEGGYLDGSWRDSGTADGKHWTVPSYGGGNIFVVRKDKLAAKGLGLPDTWDDVVKAAKAITEPGKFWGWGASIGTPSWDSEEEFSSILWCYGAKTWDESGKPAVDSPETRQVLDLYKDAWKAGIIPPDALTWDDSGNNGAYLAGKVGIIFNAPSVLAYMETKDTDLLAKSEIMLIPKGPKGRFASGYYYHWGAFKTTKYPDVCLALMEYLFSPEQRRPVYDKSAGNMMPVFKNMLNDAMWKKSPQREMVVKMVGVTVSQGYPGSTKPWIQDAWMDHSMAKMFNRVIVDGWTNDKAIAEAMTNLKKWYDEWQAKLKS